MGFSPQTATEQSIRSLLFWQTFILVSVLQIHKRPGWRLVDKSVAGDRMIDSFICLTIPDYNINLLEIQGQMRKFGKGKYCYSFSKKATSENYGPIMFTLVLGKMMEKVLLEYISLVGTRKRR